MAAIDDGPDRRTLVIADVSTDDAWLSMPVACAPWLHAWR